MSSVSMCCKKWAVVLAGVMMGMNSYSQSAASEPSLIERVFQLEKKNDLLNVSLNMHGSYDAPFGYESSGMGESSFKMQQLRLNVQGKVNDRISYRWRQRLNRPNNGAGSIDNVSSAIDYAAISLKLAQRELMAKESGEMPVLLLDDVLSELDPGRQDFVLNQIVSGRVFITCCEPGRFTKLGKTIEIQKGNVR